MKIVNPHSLAATLDAVNEAFFYGQSLPKFQREQAAKWIASRQGKPSSYANMFAPTKGDFKEGVRLFTGERVRSRAATSHILGEEACRALILLNITTAGVQKALLKASKGIMERIKFSDTRGRIPGTYCCGTCTCSYWRHLAVGGFANTERELRAGMRNLKSHRDGNGRWRRFPFYYTLLALSDIDLPSAIKEMQYAAPVCERYLRRSSKRNKINKRRRLLAERILAKC